MSAHAQFDFTWFSGDQQLPGAPSQPISPITGEELQVKFLWDSEENALKY
jgi:hypothetical protein